MESNIFKSASENGPTTDNIMREQKKIRNKDRFRY